MAGMFPQECFQIKVPYSKVFLVGSRLVTLQNLYSGVFCPLAPTPAGLPACRDKKDLLLSLVLCDYQELAQPAV